MGFGFVPRHPSRIRDDHFPLKLANRFAAHISLPALPMMNYILADQIQNSFNGHFFSVTISGRYFPVLTLTPTGSLGRCSVTTRLPPDVTHPEDMAHLLFALGQVSGLTTGHVAGSAQVILYDVLRRDLNATLSSPGLL